jgi:hypothetical protein
MQDKTLEDPTHRCTRFHLPMGLCLALLALAAGIPAAQAQAATQTAALSSPAPQHATAPHSVSPNKRYFIEFRSRSALSYGHTFLVFGKLNSKGEVGQIKADQVAGLSPFTENPWPWMIGHVVPVPAATGATDGDTEDIYITARFRVLLTKAEYDDDVAFIKKLQHDSPLWDAVFYNCNAWVGLVAAHMGLKVPSTSLIYPQDYIETLGKINGGTIEPAHPTHAAVHKPAKREVTASAAASHQTH